MKALLYKDAMVLWKQMKLMLLLILIFAVIPSEFQNTFAVLYAALLPYSAWPMTSAVAGTGWPPPCPTPPGTS